MDTIHIDASTSYDVLIGSGVIQELPAFLAPIPNLKRVMIVSDDHVFPLYGVKVQELLSSLDLDVHTFILPHGENSKNLSNYSELMEELCASRFSRSDYLIALGGGVIGDLGGFAAATYQRGIHYIQIPTTLLACVDSSVGGKTAVDLEHGKNQVGAFYQPSLVLCDIDFLATLPENEFLSGSAEVIKYGFLNNPAFLQELEATPIRDQLAHVIHVCISMKRDVVQKDEFDHGDRMLLNFGHTFGHAVEACSHFEVLHGLAVSMGMAVISRSACAMGICTQEVSDTVTRILRANHLPTEITYSLDDLVAAALSDKKVSGSKLRLILPDAVGHCCIHSIPAEEIRNWMAAGGIQ